MLHPAREVEVVLETLVAVVEVVLVGMTTLFMEETSVVEVALVAAVVVADMVAVGTVIMDLVMMVVMEEAALVTLEEAQRLWKWWTGLWKPGQWLWWERQL